MAAETDRGRVATYIPELAHADPAQFGVAVALSSGSCVSAGAATEAFSIQSISKVFSLTLALETAGAGVWSRVGREPSGSPFNSIVQLEAEQGIPRNPFINAGAIVVADILAERLGAGEAANAILALVRTLAEDTSIDIDDRVARSERRTGARNRALAQFMSAEGNLRCPVDDTLEVYFRQCAIAMSCRQLANAGRAFATGRFGAPVTMDRARRVTALMMTCGAYDASGEFAFRMGIPAKTGVGGGILGIVPGIAAIAVWCPGLDDKGNSLIGGQALAMLSRDTGWSIFGPLARG